MGTPKRSEAERESIRSCGGDLRRKDQQSPKAQREARERVSRRARKLR